MTYQSEAVLENLFIDQLKNQNYETVEIILKTYFK